MTNSQVSLRSYILVGIFGSITFFSVIQTVLLYRHAAQTLNATHDRRLTTFATLVDQTLQAHAGMVPQGAAALLGSIHKAGYADLRFRVSDAQGQLLAGEGKLPSFSTPSGAPLVGPRFSTTQAMVDGVQINLRLLLFRPPANTLPGRPPVVIEVAETLAQRTLDENTLLIGTLQRQLLIILLTAIAVAALVSKAVAPLRAIQQELLQRDETSLVPLQQPGSLETQPMIDALNGLLRHLQDARDNQQRLIANAAHQLRTPLAVLKLHLQSVSSGHVAATDVIAGMEKTVARAAHVTNQLLSLAKIDQIRQQRQIEAVALDVLTREAALELSPLITAKRLDFELQTIPTIISSDTLLTGELLRNLMSNAIRHCPAGQRLGLLVEPCPGGGRLVVSDSGQGIDESMMDDLFEPFNAASSGAGLGLAIVKSIAEAVGAQVILRNRVVAGKIRGLDAEVVFTARAV